MPRTKGDRTKLVAAKTKSDSLRTTVPSSIVRQLQLGIGDELDWQIESIELGVVKVRIVRSENSMNKE
jgi:antitoxin component of MazEF toxin-antitoxin module